MNKFIRHSAAVGAFALLGALPMVPLMGSAASAQQQMQKPAAAKPAGQQVSRRTVQQVQAALNNKGAKLEVDGYIGKDTMAALKKYQADNKLTATGEVDAATLKSLGVK